MAKSALVGSALTVQKLRLDCYNVAAIERIIRLGLTPAEMKAMIARPAFRQAFEMWREAAR